MPARKPVRGEHDDLTLGASAPLIANSFLEAYRARDAKALGALFTENAEIVDDEGEVTRGRPAIVERFAGVFAANEAGTLEVAVESIQLLSPVVAIEEGTATVSGDEGAIPDISHYSIVYAKQDGHWLHARIQDRTPSELERLHDHLKDLEWMLGEWVNESDDELVSTTCSWSDNGSFLIREFDVKIEGKVAARRKTQRIGWDPLRKQFRTWVFDSEGGFARRGFVLAHDDDGDQWIVQSSGVRADGQPVTVTSAFTPLDQDRIGWQTVARTVGGVALPGFDQYILVRQPPQPAP